MIDDLNSIAPRARSSGLVVRELEDEVLIFDVDRNAAHCLNRTAGLVWKYCDGRTSVEDIRLSLEQELGTPVSADIVWQALSDLDEDHLLDENASAPDPVSRISRRDLMKRAGVTIAVPVIASLAIPSVALAAGSAGACGATCQIPSDCNRTPADACSGTCRTVTAGACNATSRTCCVPATVKPPVGCASVSDGGVQNCLCCNGKCNPAGTACV